MIALDKNRNFYTCACKTNLVVEGSKYSTNNIFQKTKKVKKVYINKTHSTNRTNNPADCHWRLPNKLTTRCIKMDLSINSILNRKQ